MVATAAWSSRVLAMREYDVALNLGVCGSFDREIPAGNVVHVISEELPEMGAETGDAFLTLLDLKLLERDEFPFQDGRLINRKPPSMAALQQLPRVRGITVNTVHGRESSIAEVQRRCEPQVETMEGAAFMYCCLIRRTPFAEIRAVSNVVETRNRAAWKLGEAIDSLNSTALRIIDEP
jgi:futalosine hydrolase